MAMRAQTAYFLWLRENRASIVKQHGLEGQPGPAVSKKAGEVWKTVSEADRAKYVDLAAKDKARYEQEVQTLGKRERTSKQEGRAGKRAKKDKEAPKRPMSAYFLWTQENREFVMKKHGIEKAGPEFTKKAAEEWKVVADSVKKEYDAKAAAAKAQYQKDLEAYRAKCAAAGEDASGDGDGDGGEEGQ